MEEKKERDIKVSKATIQKLNSDTFAVANDLIITKGSSVLDREQLTRTSYEARRGGTDVLPTAIKDILRACKEIYNQVGIVRNTIDLMTEFASAGLDFKHQNEDIKKFYQAWARKVYLSDTIEHILFEYYLSANVGIYKTMATLPSTRKREVEKFLEGAKEKVAQEAQAGRVEIPWKYTVLNPMAMEKIGSQFFDNVHVTLTLPPQLSELIRNPKTDEEKELVRRMGKELRDAAKQGRYLLESERLYLIHRKKQPYELWAIPFLYSILSDVRYKQKLRMMDMSAADSIINAITVVKVGNDKFPASDKLLKKAAALFQEHGKSMTFVWNHAITIEAEYPPIGDILGDAKYVTVNQDILTGLGVSSVLINGDSKNNYSTSYLSVKTLLERLEDGREKVLEWLSQEMQDVADAMGFDSIPDVQFGQTNLKDETRYNELIIRLRDRNIISPETAIEAIRTGQITSFEEEVIRMKEHKKLMDKEGIFMLPVEIQTQTNVPLGKGSPGDNLNRKTGLPQTKEPGTIQGPNKKDRTVKPRGGSVEKIICEGCNETIDYLEEPEKGMGYIACPNCGKNIDQTGKMCKADNMVDIDKFLDLKERAEEIYSLVESVTTEKLLEKVGAKNISELNEEQKNVLEDVVFSNFSQMKPEYDEAKTIEMAKYFTSAPPVLERCVDSVHKGLVERWKKKNPGKKMGEKVSKELKSRSWAICNSMYKKGQL
jgi:hypothetical protein